MTLRARLAAERGWALVTALVLMTVMMGGGLATYTLVDTQTDASAQQRERESAFNLAEAAMNAEVFSLARDWPGKGMSTNQYPVCTTGSTSSRCPTSDQMAGAMPTADAAGATWNVQVRDNGSASTQGFYRDDLVLGQPGYDSNGDGKVWVRSQATAQGKTRTLVALVRAEQTPEDLPHATLISGRLDVSNNGNKPIIDASAGAGPVALRCAPASGEASPCLGHTFGSGRYKTLDDLVGFMGTQVSGTTTQYGASLPPAMTPEALARLKATAIADGTYFTGCPASLTGHVVFIDNYAGQCTYTGSVQWNSPASPGVLIMTSGSLYLGGTSDFYGVIYHANLANAAASLVQIQGNATVHGGVLLDGPGTTVAGSSKDNIVLDLSAYDAVSSYGSAGVIQNTWRELDG